MFTKIGCNKVKSDKGFIVQIADRFSLEYIANDGTVVNVYREPTPVMQLSKESIKKNNTNNFSQEHIDQIIHEINQAADFMGWKYMWY